MSKVITFSRQFPSGHAKQGGRTLFVEKMLKNLRVDYAAPEYLVMLRRLNPELPKTILFDFWTSLQIVVDDDKCHTIRAGSRFVAGESFSPRVWSDKPYNSKQIIFMDDILIQKTWIFKAKKENDIVTVVTIEDAKKPSDFLISRIAGNDGLTEGDFISWFKFPCDFNGQVICWDKTVEY